ncbi:hypothetical protein BD779DRAFT_1194642 [Infundibulicybe gibba]|nr:hypothetical protein BD779DRAFT_1194642 [Infundibulicybe gibba]
MPSAWGPRIRPGCSPGFAYYTTVVSHGASRVQLRTTLTILSMAGDDYSNTIIWIGEDASGTKEDPESSLNRFLGVLASAPSAHDQPMIRIVIQPGIYAQTQAFVMVNRILGSIVRYPWHQIGIEFPSDFNLPCGGSLLLSVSEHAPIMISIPSLQHLDLKGHFGMSFPWYSLSDIPSNNYFLLSYHFPLRSGIAR